MFALLVASVGVEPGPALVDPDQGQRLRDEVETGAMTRSVGCTLSIVALFLARRVTTSIGLAI